MLHLRPIHSGLSRLSRLPLVALLLLCPLVVSAAESRAVRIGDFDVGLSIDPDPPQTGENRLRVTLADPAGRPIDGATLALVWDMPAMGSMPEMKGLGKVKANGGGKYLVAYPLSMGGDWYLTLAIDAPAHAHRDLTMKVATGRPGVVVEATGDGESGGGIRLSAERRQLIGVTFDTVGPRPLALTLRAAGRVAAGTGADGPAKVRRAGASRRVRIDAAVSERDAGLIAVGQPARVRLDSISEPLAARVTSVAPAVDEKTRTIAVRLELADPQWALKPGRFADVAIEVPLGARLAVADSALLMSGQHRYAFVDRGGGRLDPIEVEVGALAGDYDEVRGGLSPGDRVATGATFLLSSEAKLRDALPRWRTK